MMVRLLLLFSLFLLNPSFWVVLNCVSLHRFAPCTHTHLPLIVYYAKCTIRRRECTLHRRIATEQEEIESKRWSECIIRRTWCVHQPNIVIATVYWRFSGLYNFHSLLVWNVLRLIFGEYDIMISFDMGIKSLPHGFSLLRSHSAARWCGDDANDVA